PSFQISAVSPGQHNTSRGKWVHVFGFQARRFSSASAPANIPPAPKRQESRMTGLSLFLTALGGAVIAAGAAMFVGYLVGVRRRTCSANLEYGILPAVPVAIGLWLVDRGVGWPGWPGPAYFLVATGLAVPFTIAIVWR
ncbi:MAG: hypothetical protein V3S45_04435, partial [Kiloniellales bacterium]